MWFFFYKKGKNRNDLLSCYSENLSHYSFILTYLLHKIFCHFHSEEGSNMSLCLILGLFICGYVFFIPPVHQCVNRCAGYVVAQNERLESQFQIPAISLYSLFGRYPRERHEFMNPLSYRLSSRANWDFQPWV